MGLNQSIDISDSLFLYMNNEFAKESTPEDPWRGSQSQGGAFTLLTGGVVSRQGETGRKAYDYLDLRQGEK